MRRISKDPTKQPLPIFTNCECEDGKTCKTLAERECWCQKIDMKDCEDYEEIICPECGGTGRREMTEEELDEWQEKLWDGLY
jgi:hypothetical protein